MHYFLITFIRKLLVRGWKCLFMHQFLSLIFYEQNICINNSFSTKTKIFLHFYVEESKSYFILSFIWSSKISIEISKKDESTVFRGIPSHNKHVKVFFGSKVVAVIPFYIFLSLLVPHHHHPIAIFQILLRKINDPKISERLYS